MVRNLLQTACRSKLRLVNSHFARDNVFEFYLIVLLFTDLFVENLKQFGILFRCESRSGSFYGILHLTMHLERVQVCLIDDLPDEFEADLVTLNLSLLEEVFKVDARELVERCARILDTVEDKWIQVPFL